MLALLAAMAVSVNLFANTSISDAYYDQLLADGKLDITLAMGFVQYEPDLPGVASILDGPVHMFTGAWPNRDIFDDVLRVTERELLEDCDGCGFTEKARAVGYRLFVSEMRYYGRTIPVRLKWIFPEPGVDVNWLRQMYVYALGHDEVILYVGHARDGHGFPDFASPLADRGKVFVRDGDMGWRGFEQGYFARKKYQILSLNACKSFQYYRDPIRKFVWEKDPATLALLLNRAEEMPWSDLPDMSAALISGLMQHLPRQQLLDAIEEKAEAFRTKNPEVKERVTVADGLFDETYAGRTPPKMHEPETWRDMPF